MKKTLGACVAVLVLGFAAAAYAGDKMDSGNAMQGHMDSDKTDGMSKSDDMSSDKGSMGASDSDAMKGSGSMGKDSDDHMMAAPDKDKGKM